jgi:SAM-dependent methyltransferase
MLTSEQDPRLTFDAVPDSYDRARPEYPAQAFDDLFARMRRGRSLAEPQVCEIGPGTGQATKGLLARGARVTAVEIGPNLASFLRRKFASESRLDVVTGAFEEAQLPPGSFEMVFAATSWHWLERASRVQRTVSLLREGGLIATFSAIQVHEAVDRDFFERGDPIYRRHGRTDRFVQTPKAEEAMPDDLAEFRESPLLRDVEVRKYRWDQRYSADEYEELVRSYSNTQTMPLPEREGLIADLKAFIEAEFDGYVVRPLVIALTMARRS